ncbi:MAG: hypothetical protein JF592_17960 [Microbacterium sp.]|uniref:hypothetical protein n=1 Tax=Microbacterium sp. TaxID=51671 RepID=UPI001DC4D19C|nr:hypothetical protein [Microbacterium sp.]MBW8764433.1 hypothetical protein [Microbacterium sp.]
MVTDQPALRTSSGAIWIIVAALFTAVSLVPLIAIVADGSSAAPVALVTASLLVSGLVALVIVRLTVTERSPRLRALAGCFLGMTLVTLIGLLICVAIVWAPLTG